MRRRVGLAIAICVWFAPGGVAQKKDDLEKALERYRKMFSAQPGQDSRTPARPAAAVTLNFEQTPLRETLEFLHQFGLDFVFTRDGDYLDMKVSARMRGVAVHDAAAAILQAARVEYARRGTVYAILGPRSAGPDHEIEHMLRNVRKLELRQKTLELELEVAELESIHREMRTLMERMARAMKRAERRGYPRHEQKRKDRPRPRRSKGRRSKRWRGRTLQPADPRAVRRVINRLESWLSDPGAQRAPSVLQARIGIVETIARDRLVLKGAAGRITLRFPANRVPPGLERLRTSSLVSVQYWRGPEGLILHRVLPAFK